MTTIRSRFAARYSRHPFLYSVAVCVVGFWTPLALAVAW